MGQTTKIQWTHHTWSPWWGCTKVSAGCANCYADRDANRWGFKVWGDNAPRRMLSEKHWGEPLKWDRAARDAGELRRIFPSMCDPYEDRPELEDPRHRMHDLVERTPNLIWLLLTKRPENVDAMVPMHWTREKGKRWPKNAWLLTSVENQDTADERIPELLKLPAPVRGLSMEPLLAPVDFQAYCHSETELHRHNADGTSDLLAKRYKQWIHWIIAGGESGPKARPMHPSWARSIRDQCQAAGVPFFFKQWGEWAPVSQTQRSTRTFQEELNLPSHQFDDGAWTYRMGKEAAGRQLDGREWNEVPAC